MLPRRLRSRNRNGNDDEDDPTEGLPPFFRPGAMPGGGRLLGPLDVIMPAMMEEVFGREGRERRVPRNTFPLPLKCPSCQFSHPYAPFNLQGTPPLPPDNRFSHNGRVIFESGPCPICLDGDAGPPRVSLTCGHCFCVDCFGQLGGKSGDDAQKSREEAGRAEYEAYRQRLREENNNQDALEDEEGDAVLPEEALAMLFEMMSMQYGPFGGSDEEDYDDGEDYGDYEENDDETDEEMPELVAVDAVNTEASFGQSTNNDDDGSDRASQPAPRVSDPGQPLPRVLESTTARTLAGTVTDAADVPRPLERVMPSPGAPLYRPHDIVQAAHHEDDEEDSLEDLPPLVPRPRDDLSSSEEDAPPLMNPPTGSNSSFSSTRQSQSSEENSFLASDEEPPPLVADLVDYDGVGSESDGGVLPHLQRRGYSGNESSDCEDNAPTSVARRATRGVDRNSNNVEEDLPPMRLRGAGENVDDSSEDSVPALLVRNNQPRDDDSSTFEGEEHRAELTTYRPALAVQHPSLRPQFRMVQSPFVLETGCDVEAAVRLDLDPVRSEDTGITSDYSSHSDGPSGPTDYPRDYDSSGLDSDVDDDHLMPSMELRSDRGRIQGGQPPLENDEWSAVFTQQANVKSSESLMQDVLEMNLNLPRHQNILRREQLEEMWVTAKVKEKRSGAVISEIEASLPALISQEPPPLVPADPAPLDGVWTLSRDDLGSLLEFIFVGVDKKIETVQQGHFGSGSKLIPSASRGLGIVWMAEKQENNDKQWRLSFVRPRLDSVRMTWVYNEVYKTIDWCIDRAGTSYIIQEVSSENLRLVRVNGQHPGGQVLEDGLKGYESMYPSHAGVWITNGQNRREDFAVKFISSDVSKIVQGPVESQARFCPSWTRESIIILYADAANPGHSIVKECQADGCRQRTIPVTIGNVKDLCTEGDLAVLLHCKIGEGFELRRAEWRFQKKFERVLKLGRHSQIVSDGLGGGVWLWKKANKGTHRNLIFVDMAGNEVDRCRFAGSHEAEFAFFKK